MAPLQRAFLAGLEPDRLHGPIVAARADATAPGSSFILGAS
jgi:hypothetical protein